MCGRVTGDPEKTICWRNKREYANWIFDGGFEEGSSLGEEDLH